MNDILHIITNASEIHSFKHDFVLVYVNCKMLLTSIFQCQFIFFSRLVAKSCLCMQAVSNVWKVSEGLNAVIRYGSLLKVNLGAQSQKLELIVRTCSVNLVFYMFCCLKLDASHDGCIELVFI